MKSDAVPLSSRAGSRTTWRSSRLCHRAITAAPTHLTWHPWSRCPLACLHDFPQAAALSLISLCNCFAFHQCIVLQVRGSFPLYWSQQGGKLGKPDILLQNFDPLFSATRAHFSDMQVVASFCDLLPRVWQSAVALAHHMAPPACCGMDCCTLQGCIAFDFCSVFDMFIRSLEC